MYHETVGYSATVSPILEACGTNATADSTGDLFSALQLPRVAPLWVFTGPSVGVLGGRKFDWFGSWLLSEGGLNWACTCAGTFTASPRLKATVNTRIIKRDERLNQAMIKVFARRAGLFNKDGRTQAYVPTHQ
jgi:hypothetical protein